MANPAATQAIDVGTLVAGTYQITRLLGEGGMGAVWEAKHLRLESTRVAIKVLHAEVAGDDESVVRFRREAQIASRLGHPNIVQVLDFNELADGTQYLVLEYLEGESLAERLARGPLALEQALAIVRQVGSALHAAHREQIIHRDLKPHNLFLCPTEAGGYVTEKAKVLDFGISKIRGSQTVMTQASTMLGTPQYMAPEQALGDHANVDARTDIFALGAIVYEMLVGRPAFQGTTIPEVVFKVVYEEPAPLSQIIPSMDPGVAGAVHRALAKKQEERFADVSAFVQALTGAPLTTLRGARGVASPLAASPLAAPLMAATGAATGAARTGESRIKTQDALAATMAPNQESAQDGAATVALTPRSERPGIAAGAIGPTTTTTAAPAGKPASIANTVAPSIANTVAPQGSLHPAAPSHGTAGASLPGALQSTVSHGVGQVEPAAKSRTSPLMLIALVVAAAAMAVVVTIFVMRPTDSGGDLRAVTTGASAQRGERDKTSEDPTSSAAEGERRAGGDADKDSNIAASGGDKTGVTGDKTGATEATGDTKKDGATKDQGNASGQGSTKDKGDTEDSPAKRASPDRRPKRGASEPTDKDALKKLVSARRYLKSGNYAYAVRDARSSLVIQPTQAAYVLIVRAYCADHNFSDARANLTHLRGAAKRHTIRYCAKYDIDLSGL